MKKLFSHPNFHFAFPLLGLLGCGLQLWFSTAQPDSRGLLPQFHPATVLTVVLVALSALLAILSASHVQPPRYSAAVRAVGAAMGGAITAISAVLLLMQKNTVSGVMAILSVLASVYAVWARLSKKKLPFWVYALFAIYHMLYLISRYQAWSAEPEIVRFAFQLLALVCSMLLFYQKAALHARSGKFGLYHFWHSMALMLCLTAIPCAQNPTVYLSAAIWLLLDPSPRPRPKEAPVPEQTA